MNWVCIQIGRREHYAIPRALRRNGDAVRLVTDFWSPKWKWGNATGRLIPAALLDRRVEEDVGEVSAFNARCLVHEIGSRIKGGAVFERALRRNEWFTARLGAFFRRQEVPADVVFSYSYAATAAIRFARARKVPFILGQIDGGLYEEELLKRTAGHGKGAPPSYWQAWKQEVAAADAVVVNSEWSAECLARSECSPKRVEVIPLAYAPRPEPPARRIFPPRFSQERPLNILFLGQVILRKGLGPLLEAVERVAANNLPIRFTIVGGGDPELIGRIRVLPNAIYHGHASPQAVGEYYKQADLFILPTLSDGFALTQLEAQSYGLPIIASKRCGKVVVEGRNGVLLEEVTGEAIYKVIAALCHDPMQVKKLTEGSEVDSRYSLENIGKEYASLARSLVNGPADRRGN